VGDGVRVNDGVNRVADVLVISTKDEVGSNISNDDGVSASKVVRDGTNDENGLEVVVTELDTAEASVVEGVTRGENDAVTEAGIAELVEKTITVGDSCRVSVGVKTVSVGISSNDVVSGGSMLDIDSVAVISLVVSIVVSDGKMNREVVSVKIDDGKGVSSGVLGVGIDSVMRVLTEVNTTVSVPSMEVVGTTITGSDVDVNITDGVNTLDTVG
jgi:hypothetical protein